MSVQVHTGVEPKNGDLARCEVVTVDATGRERWYDISLISDDTFDDGYLLAGRQTHPSRCPVVTGRAYDAAREHFRDLGFEVHEA